MGFRVRAAPNAVHPNRILMLAEAADGAAITNLKMTDAIREAVAR